MKQGEAEAQLILTRIGIDFDTSYCDDNSKESMPDLRTSIGRFIEVTHTFHNQDAVSGGNKYKKLSQEKKNKRMAEAYEAYQRIKNKDYEIGSDFQLTDSALIKYQHDIKIVRDYYGSDCCGNFSEFKCDLPIVEHSVNNVLQEIKDKGAKHTDVHTDLFIFATNDEYRLLLGLTEEKWNSAYSQLFDTISMAPFHTIYVCSWNLEMREYYTCDSTMIVFENKTDHRVMFKEIRY